MTTLDFENGKDADYAAEINANAMAEPEIKVDEPLPPDPAGAALCVTSGFATLAYSFNKAIAIFQLALHYDPNSADAYLGLLLADVRISSLAVIARTKKHFWESKYYKPLCKLASPVTLALLKENRARIEAEEERIRAEREARSEKTRAFMKKHRAAISICSILLVVATTPTSMFFAGVFDAMFADEERETATTYFLGTTFELQPNGEGYTVTGYTHNNPDYEYLYIPETHNGRPITAIGNHAFSYSDYKGISIPDSVTSIGDYAFFGCSNLTTVCIPTSVKNIRVGAFNNGKTTLYLESISTPSGFKPGWDSGCKVVYGADLDNLPPVEAPDDVPEIPGHTHLYNNKVTDERYLAAEANCTSGAKYYFSCTCGAMSSNTFVVGVANDKHKVNPTGYCTICNQPITSTEGVVYDLSGDGTYAEVIGYNGSATRVIIADTYKDKPVKTIYKEAFRNNDNITGVTIPDSVTSIGSSAFQSCDRLTSVTIGNGVTSIGDQAFQSCTSLTSVTIGNGVTSIGDSAFRDCYSLTSVTIGNGVTSIGSSAFESCSKLTSVTIPDSVTSIGNQAFSYCNSALYTEYEYGRYVGDDNNPYALLYELTNKNFTTYKIHEQTKIIGYGVFRECGRLSTITIPDSVTSIGNHAFALCSRLTGVTIPDSVTSIGDYAFYSCNSLTSVTIGDGVTSIGDYAFNGCSSLNTAYYNGTADEWGDISIHYGNDSLKNATRYYYSESEPTVVGNFWHYVDGVPTKWE